LSQAEVDQLKSWDSKPEQSIFELMRSASREQIIWGGNHFLDSLGTCRAPLIWDKRNRRTHFADGEMAWTSFKRGTLRIFERKVQGTEIIGKRLHPTQKPVALMEWCLGYLPKAKTILDPFMGSGTTGVACIRSGRKFIGIEKSRSYFEIARKRLKAELETIRSTTDLTFQSPPRGG